MMEKQMLYRAVCRCLKDEVLDVLRRWNVLSEESLSQINLKKTKTQIAADIYEFCKDERVEVQSIGELDLIYSQIHADCRKWSVFKLEGQEMDHFISNPQIFRKMLSSKIKLFFDKVIVNVNLFSGALWARIHVIDRKYPNTYKPNDVIYMVHYPRTPYVILSRIRPKDEESLFEALLPVFKTNQFEPLQLSGRHVSSLVELALNKDSQGSFGKYRNLEERENPYARKSKKRKAPSEPEREIDKRLKSENQAKKKERTEILDNTFGTTEQPTLEKLEYKMNVKFRGTKYAPDMIGRKKPFKCRIKFEGTSVLEGIRNLGKAGLASVPLPRHLASVNSDAKNYFVIGEKSSEKQTD